MREEMTHLFLVQVKKEEGPYFLSLRRDKGNDFQADNVMPAKPKAVAAFRIWLRIFELESDKANYRMEEECFV